MISGSKPFTLAKSEKALRRCKKPQGFLHAPDRLFLRFHPTNTSLVCGVS